MARSASSVKIVGKPETTISDITLENIDVSLKERKLELGNVKNLRIHERHCERKTLLAAERKINRLTSPGL